ncbi:MAG: ester cyclase [Actinomycetota bacterium]
MDVYRIENGKIAELWHQIDTLGMLQQVGAIPSQ